MPPAPEFVYGVLPVTPKPAKPVVQTSVHSLIARERARNFKKPEGVSLLGAFSGEPGFNMKLMNLISMFPRSHL